MLGVGFESTIPVFERAKTVHALDRAATVIGGRRTARRFIPDDGSLHNDRYENLKYYALILLGGGYRF
jgi:hypothetical protein